MKLTFEYGGNSDKKLEASKDGDFDLEKVKELFDFLYASIKADTAYGQYEELLELLEIKEAE